MFLREVDDALREDELRTAFQRWGKLAIVGLIVGLAALGGFLFWQQHSSQATAQQAEKFSIALDNVEAGNLKDGDAKLAALVQDSGGGTKAAAQLMRGGVAERQGKAAEAVKLFEAVAADSAPQPYRDLAAIRAVAANFDGMKPADVVSRLKPLAEPGKPWFGSAGELVALAYLKQGRNDLAGPLFAAIAKDKDSPASLRSRAMQMAGVLGVDAIEEVDGVAKGTNAGPGQN